VFVGEALHFQFPLVAIALAGVTLAVFFAGSLRKELEAF